MADPVQGDKELRLQVYSAWAYLSFIRRDLKKTLTYADKMESLVDENDNFTLVQAESYKAMGYWFSGALDRAYGDFTDFRDEMFAADVPAFVLGSYLALTQIRILQGRIPEALRLFDEALKFDRGTVETLSKMKASLHLKALSSYFELGDPKLRDKHLEISGKLSQADNLIDYHYQWHQLQALLHESQGRWDKALKELDVAQHLFVLTPTV